MSKILTVKQAAQEFFDSTLSEGMIYILVRQKKIPHVRVGRRILLDEDALRQWWEEELAKSTKRTKK
ncbi:helix-turn-helix domain-containing protein [Thermoanaerobacter mathranii]|uniref:helix-turn-helix domain-containing protein n=1 Tax=Thermoanaerobacter mathranii TaxID=583357 RepID=UPI003AB05AC5